MIPTQPFTCTQPTTWSLYHLSHSSINVTRTAFLGMGRNYRMMHGSLLWRLVKWGWLGKIATGWDAYPVPLQVDDGSNQNEDLKALSTSDFNRLNIPRNIQRETVMESKPIPNLIMVIMKAVREEILEMTRSDMVSGWKILYIFTCARSLHLHPTRRDCHQWQSGSWSQMPWEHRWVREH